MNTLPHGAKFQARFDERISGAILQALEFSRCMAQEIGHE